MIEILKNLFSRKKKEAYVPDPPGRTFKRIETGRYFGCEDANADKSSVSKAKQKKIDQITELGLVPMFIRYSYEDTNKNETQTEDSHPDPEVSSVHVVFQKEVTAEKWNMIHVTEISFTVHRSDFNEFEKMSRVSLNNDFRDLTSYEKNAPYNGIERRKKKRDV